MHTWDEEDKPNTSHGVAALHSVTCTNTKFVFLSVIFSALMNSLEFLWFLIRNKITMAEENKSFGKGRWDPSTSKQLNTPWVSYVILFQENMVWRLISLCFHTHYSGSQSDIRERENYRTSWYWNSDIMCWIGGQQWGSSECLFLLSQVQITHRHEETRKLKKGL